MAKADHQLPDSIFADLDRTGPMPLYHQIATRLKAAIHDGVLSAGDRLENEVSISQRLGISRPTIRRAIEELVDDGLLVRRRGVGTQVVHGRINRPVELSSLFDDLSKQGQSPSTKLLLLERATADEVAAEALGVDAGSPVLHIRRLRYADGAPLAVMDNILPEAFLDITEEEIETHGLYQLLSIRGVTHKVAKQQIGARAATTEEASLLKLPRNAAVLTATRVTYDTSGIAVELGTHCYNPDRYQFDITLVNR